MYRASSVTCPSCAVPLAETVPGQLQCSRCNAEHVTPERIVELLREVAPDIAFPMRGVVAFPQPLGAARTRCPHCRKLMTAAVLFEVLVDQCIGDGLWFQRDRLAQVLLNAAARFAERS